MATFDLAGGSNNTTVYRNGTQVNNSIITKVTDSQTDLVFNVGDTVRMTVSETDGTVRTVLQAEYVGTVSVTESGQTKELMVLKIVQGTQTFHYVVGADRSAAPATIVETGTGANVTAETFTVCFFPGTLISTPSGERRVEDLVPGDSVLIGDANAVPVAWTERVARNLLQWLGFRRAAPVKWIGRQTVSTLFGPAERLMPVRFAAGSLGGGGGGQPLLPHSDLTVTADHAMLVDGVLCEAGALVNGTTITRVPLSEFCDSYTVYHVETEAHQVVLANGAPAETFVDNVSRRAFDNCAEFAMLHGDQPEMKELPYPRASNARHLPAKIKSRLGIGSGKQTAA